MTANISPEVTFYLSGILNGNLTLVNNICQIVITSTTATVLGKNKPAASTSPSAHELVVSTNADYIFKKKKNE